jgi:Rieske Fe-S protein
MSVSRRAWLSELLRAVSTSATAVVGLLGMRAAIPPATRPGVVRCASSGDRVSIVDDALVVRRGMVVRAFSLRCPHLGCRVRLDGDGKGLTCPCHGSRFDLDGNRVHGPATRGLTELQVDLAPSSG